MRDDFFVLINMKIVDHRYLMFLFIMVWFGCMVFIATFNNISAIL